MFVIFSYYLPHFQHMVMTCQASSIQNFLFSVIKTMCTDIVDKWMEKVRGKNNENSGKQGMLNYLGMM